jgi:hypothetical protein
MLAPFTSKVDAGVDVPMPTFAPDCTSTELPRVVCVFQTARDRGVPPELGLSLAVAVLVEFVALREPDVPPLLVETCATGFTAAAFAAI